MIWSWLLSLFLLLVYWFLIVPCGLVKQVLFNAKARYGYNKEAKTYWVPRTTPSKTIDMTKQS